MTGRLGLTTKRSGPGKASIVVSHVHTKSRLLRDHPSQSGEGRHLRSFEEESLIVIRVTASDAQRRMRAVGLAREDEKEVPLA